MYYASALLLLMVLIVTITATQYKLRNTLVVTLQYTEIT